MKCLYLAAHWPSANLSAAGKRTWDLLNAIRIETGASIDVACHAEMTTEHFDAPFPVDIHNIELNRASFDAWLVALAPDWVIFDRFITEEQYGWRVAKHLPSAMRILDMQDLHSLRYARAEVVKATGSPVSQVDLVSQKTFIRELASILRSDVSLVISQYELKLLEEVFNRAGVLPSIVSLSYLPFTYFDEDLNQETPPAFNDRKNLIFIGNFLHEPNWDAVRWLRSSIWPQIRKALPTVECHIYGAFCRDKVNQLHNDALGFLIKGQVEGSIKHLVESARLNLAPLRFGAGLKGKLFDAALWKTPTITTAVGCEGLWPETSLGVANTEASFVESVLMAYSHESHWQTLQCQQFESIKQAFHHSKCFPSALQHIEKVHSELPHRPLLKQLLCQESNRGHEYFSRWIELKETR